jgi:hypothetical protein
MKCIKKLEALLNSVGGSLEDRDGYLVAVAPKGYFWEATDSRIIVRMAEDQAGNRWYRDAVAELEAEMTDGLRLCTKAEVLAVEYESGEDWQADVNAVEYLGVKI